MSASLRMRSRHEVDDLLADGVVTTGEVVRGVLLAGDELLGVEELAVGTGADLVDHGGLEIEEDAAGDVLAGTSLGEEGVEGIVAATDGLVGGHLAAARGRSRGGGGRGIIPRSALRSERNDAFFAKRPRFGAVARDASWRDPARAKHPTEMIATFSRSASAGVDRARRPGAISARRDPRIRNGTISKTAARRKGPEAALTQAGCRARGSKAPSTRYRSGYRPGRCGWR